MLFIPEVHDTNKNLTKFGVMDQTREFYIYVDNVQLTMKDNQPFSTIMVQVNKSVNDGAILTISPTRGNNKQINKNVYIYDAYFPRGIKDFRDGEFTLRNASSSQIYTDYDRKISRTKESALYSDSIVDNVPYANFLEELCGTSEPMIPPNYYNRDHTVDGLKNNMYNLIWGITRYNYSGGDLLDSNSKIHLVGSSNYVGIDTPTENDGVEEELANRLFLPTNENMITKATFIYDTQLGFNILGGEIPYNEHMYKQFIINSYEQIKAKITTQAQLIEKTEGSIRLYYNPTDVGDKVRVEYKDRKINNKGKALNKDYVYNIFMDDLF